MKNLQTQKDQMDCTKATYLGPGRGALVTYIGSRVLFWRLLSGTRQVRGVTKCYWITIRPVDTPRLTFDGTRRNRNLVLS